jgi:hypothetical protein
VLVDPSTKVDLRDLYRRSSQFLGIDDYVKIATVIDIDAITNPGNVTIETPSRKAFEIEGAILKQALSDCLRNQRAALAQLADAARQVDKAAFGSTADFGPAHQALLKALDRAEVLLQG